MNAATASTTPGIAQDAVMPKPLGGEHATAPPCAMGFDMREGYLPVIAVRTNIARVRSTGNRSRRSSSATGT